MYVDELQVSNVNCPAGEVPDQLLICFSWEKGLVLSTTTHSSGGLNAVNYKGVIRHLATHPKDPHYFGVAGDDDLLKVCLIFEVARQIWSGCGSRRGGVARRGKCPTNAP